MILDFIHNIGTPICVTDRSGKVLRINESFSEMTGFSSAEIIGHTAERLLPEDSFDRWHAFLNLAVENPGQSLKERSFVMRRLSGRPIEVNLIGSLIEQDSLHVLILTFEDLTEVRRLQKETEKIQFEKSQAAHLADMGRLTAGIAHELNNPLSVILGMSENMQMILEEDYAHQPQLIETFRPMIEENIQTSKRMALIIQKMMIMIQQEKPTLEKISLNRICQDLWEGPISKRLAKFEVPGAFEMDSDCEIFCDRILFEQVVLNLVNNAIFETLKVSQKGIILRTKVSDKMVAVEVENRGEMIPKEFQSKIFTPFATTKKPGQGTGLGLFVSHHVVKAHDGNLTFETHPDQTVFRITLPRRKM